jgi:hypothetical protein
MNPVRVEKTQTTGQPLSALSCAAPRASRTRPSRSATSAPRR